MTQQPTPAQIVRIERARRFCRERQLQRQQRDANRVLIMFGIGVGLLLLFVAGAVWLGWIP